MSEVYTGFVARLTTKTGKKGNGEPWTKWSAKIEQKDGTEYNDWVSLGFDDPGIKEGDYIRVQVEDNNGYKQIVKGTTVQKNTKNPPARAQKQQNSTQRGNGGGFRRSGGGGGGGNRFDGTGIQNRSNPEDVKRMTYANARTAAIALVDVLLSHDALPSSIAKTKAGQASRFDEALAAVDKLTVRFHNDGLTLRLLETVADTVTETKADGPLPDKETADAGKSGGAESFDEDSGSENDGEGFDSEDEFEDA